MKRYYKQPKYYSEFRCIGSDCPVNCCRNWRIDWTKEEYEKLKKVTVESVGLPAPDKCIEVNENSDDFYHIIFNERGYCPYLDETCGLCGIQMNFGEEYLGVICRVYPRTRYKRENIVFRMCSSSCSEVVRMLIEHEGAADLETVAAHDVDSIDKRVLHFDDVSEVRSSPYLRFRMDILDFYVWLFRLKTSMDNIIVLGALAARKLSDASTGGSANDIPVIIKDMKKQYDSVAIIKSVGDIGSNYDIKFVIVNNMLVKYMSENKEIISEVSDLNEGAPNNRNYIKGKERFEESMADNEWAMKNIALNIFYDVFIHLNFTKRSFWDMYTYYTACMATIQILGYSAGFAGGDIREKFILNVSELCRSIAHNITRANEITNYINECGFVSPAHLAVIIKG